MDASGAPAPPTEPPLTADFLRGADIFNKLKESGSGATLWDCVGAAMEERKAGLVQLQKDVDDGCVLVDPDGHTIATSADLQRITRGTTCSTIRFKPKTEKDREEAIRVARENKGGAGRTIIIEPPSEKNVGCCLQ